MNDDIFEQVRRGGFARIQLRGGPLVSGYAATDPEDARFVRLDGLLREDDGGLSPFSLRFTTDDVESIEALADPPRFRDADGSSVVMPASFWSEETE